MTRSRVRLVGDIEIPIVFLAMAAICMWAYFQNTEQMSEYRKKRVTLILASVGMLPILLLTRSNSYWCVYSVPFCLLVLCDRQEGLFIRIVLERASALALTAAYMITFPWYSGSVDGMLPSFFMKGVTTDDLPVCRMIADFLMQEKYFYFWTLTYATYMIWVIGYLHCELRQEESALSVIGKERPWVDGTQRGLSALVGICVAASFLFSSLYAIVTVLLARYGG